MYPRSLWCIIIIEGFRVKKNGWSMLGKLVCEVFLSIREKLDKLLWVG